MKKIIVALLALITQNGMSQTSELKTVNSVDLKKYTGKWYEIADIPQRFQKGCTCTTAEYSIREDGKIKVLNSCRKNSPTGKLKTATAKAWVVEGSNNSKLKVRFFWPFTGKYWIIKLADDYSYAVVGHPSRKYLWILNRDPKMDEALYNSIITSVKEMGYDTNLIVRTNQLCN